MPEIVSFGRDNYVENLCKIIQNKAEECLKENDRFTVAVSGSTQIVFLKFCNIVTYYNGLFVLYCL